MEKSKVVLSDFVEPVFTTPDSFSHWYGYYNTSPLDINNRRLLAHRVDFDARAITAGDSAEVGWFDLKNGSWNSLGRTSAFNWQQGSMLQWLDKNTTAKVIFNDVIDHHYGARVVNLEGDEERVISWPIYGVTPDGGTSISLQFERSFWCRAYHYEPIRNPRWEGRIAEGDGIFRVDLQEGTVKRIISIEDILRFDYDLSFDASKHWLEHIMLNTSGSRFAFYHRFSEQEAFKTRVFTANLDGSDIYMLSDWRDNQWSHLGWQNIDTFVVFGIKRLMVGKAYEKVALNTGLLGQLLRNVYRRYISPHVNQRTHHSLAASSCYQKYIDKCGFRGQFTKGRLLNDGHPSFSLCGSFMLTDTYEDAENYRHLLLYDIERNWLFELGKFYSPFNSCGYRSDLHPRFSPDNQYIVIDSAHSGRHQMVVLGVNWDAIKHT